MRKPHDLRAELSDLRQTLATLREADLAAYPAMQLTEQGLQRRLESLTIELSEAQVPSLKFAVEGLGVADKTVRIDFLSRLLSDLQESLASVGQALEAGFTSRGVIPLDIREGTALRLSGVFTGSFGLILEGPRVPEEPPLLEMMAEPEPVLFEQAVDNLLDIIDATRLDDASGTVIDRVGPLGPRVLRNIRGLSDVLATHEVDAQFRWHPVAGIDRTVRLEHSSARRLGELLGSIDISERDLQIRGRLVGASLVTDRFELQTETGEVIRGRVEPALRESLHLYFSRMCLASLHTTITRSRIDGKEKEHYTLTAVSSAASNVG